jgi:hypothetical protein
MSFGSSQQTFATILSLAISLMLATLLGRMIIIPLLWSTLLAIAPYKRSKEVSCHAEQQTYRPPRQALREEYIRGAATVSNIPGGA